MPTSYEVFHRDIRTLVDFYVDVLGFDPPETDMSSGYVVVRRNDVRVGCCRHDEADPSERRPPAGSEIVLRVDDIQADYDRVLLSGWPIADPLQTRPWGLTDFRVFDPAGQYLRITNAIADTRAENAGRARPDGTSEACSHQQGYALVDGPPTVADYVNLRTRTGLSPRRADQAAAAVRGGWAATHVIECTGGAVVGMGRVIGDGGWYFHVVDIAVLPEHQRRGLGDMILTSLLANIREHAPQGAYVSLMADAPGRSLYAKHGFVETAPASLGMAQILD